ncbi:hypothetical protein ST47_g2771 [Ascochyta rabiei]|uniref:CSD domain-containing protein n=1 Tax=Didymella rabiei TaxID=5454 RepID=A0A163J211_DIDRA|nr:hypothetical protein ST47_g2771 [Ascochyta rabiei]
MLKYRGTVKYSDEKKGTGFITLENGKSTVYMHHSAIHDDGVSILTAGPPVEFEILITAKGPAAIKV